MKSWTKRSWQIPFLLFLIIGTYYTLSEHNKQPRKIKASDSSMTAPTPDTATQATDSVATFLRQS